MIGMYHECVAETDSAASWPSTWATESSPILDIPGRTSMTPNGRTDSGVLAVDSGGRQELSGLQPRNPRKDYRK